MLANELLAIKPSSTIDAFKWIYHSNIRKIKKP